MNLIEFMETIALLLASIYRSIPYAIGTDIAAGLGLGQAAIITYFVSCFASILIGRTESENRIALWPGASVVLLNLSESSSPFCIS